MSKAEWPVTSVNQLSGFLHAVSSTPGATEHQQKAGVYVHSQCAGEERPGAISQLSWFLALLTPLSNKAQEYPTFISIPQYSIPPPLECHFPACCMLAQTIPVRLYGN